MSVHEGGEPQIGIIKFYNPRKGYGFVTRPEGNDVFFHLTHFRTMTVPAPGAVVQFSLGQNREGLTAEDMVVVPPDTVECYGGVITALDSEGGEIVTPDNFAISFRRSDFIPHTRADSLKVGDEVEMHFLMQEADESWRAKVVRSPGYQPESSVGARTERHEPDEEEENRRMLGILYKTDLDEEALQAARSLAERNMRATLSALVSRVFDHRLEPVTRRALVELIPSIYFDDDCQVFLETMTARLREALELEEGPGDAAAGEVLCLLLDDAHFPVRWSQYLLPFGLSLLRNLAPLTPCQALLDEPAQAEAMEVWLTRVCRHVEQRRSGHGYVLTTALATCDELWRRESLHEPLRRVLARLLVALDAEGLANQIYHLRDKITPEFLPVLLPLISQHPDLSQALRSPAQSEIFAQWIEMLLRGSGE
ncbi:MAG: cold shock domain-containing protein, partial [Armatimonadetes bacterium]|nr:cold shock domain-containing protein [Armatimonadota bacterium]